MTETKKEGLEFEVLAHTMPELTLYYALPDEKECGSIRKLGTYIKSQYRTYLDSMFITDQAASEKPLIVRNYAKPAHITNEVSDDPFLCRPLSMSELEELLKVIAKE